VLDLCTSALLLDRGAVHATGSPQDVINSYLSQSNTSHPDTVATRKLILTRAEVCALDETQRGPLTSGAPCRLQAHFVANAPAEDVVFTVYIRQAQSGSIVYGADSTFVGAQPVSFLPGDEVDVTFNFHCNLLRGSYFVEMYAYHPGSRENFEWRSPAAFFEVGESDSNGGVAALFATCYTTRASRSTPSDSFVTG
jgi:hypothetical protein